MMKRGDIVLCSMSADFGKVRPAIVVQSGLFNGIRETTSLCPLTTTDVEAPLFRIVLEPSPANRLKKRSWVMIDKVCSIKNSRIREIQGTLNGDEMKQLDIALKQWLALG